MELNCHFDLGVWYWYANIARLLLIGHHCIWVEQSFLYTKWMMGKTCHCRTTSHTKKCLTELLHYQGKWSKRKQWLAWQLSSNFSLLLSLICTHMGGKGICVNEASQKIAKYSSSLSDLKTVAHSCKHAIIHVSSACNPMKRRRFPKQNDKKQSNFQENRQIAPTAQKRGLRPTLSFCILITSVVLFLISKRCFCLIMTV